MTWEDEISPEIDAIAKQIVDAAFKVHSTLGPGLLESAYEACLAHELRKRGLTVERQIPVPVVYDGIEMGIGFRADLCINGCVLVELKTVEQLASIHSAQLMTYLKLTGFRIGFLINFNTKLIKDGIKRIVF